MDFATGGYMDTSFDNSSGNQGGYSRKPMSENTMRSLTIKQMKGAEVPQEGVFKIDSAEVTQVTFVGVIRSVSELSTNHVYTIEDGTGAIEARKWVEQNESPEEADARRALMVDTYVRVNGKLNSFSNRISFMAHNIRPITDFNEITYHYLDAIHTHLSLVKPSKSTAYSDTMGGFNSTGSIHDRVNATIKSFEDTVDGCSVDQICFKLRELHTEPEIREALEYLQTEGQCYTTVDSEHFKSCLP